MNGPVPPDGAAVNATLIGESPMPGAALAVTLGIGLTVTPTVFESAVAPVLSVTVIRAEKDPAEA